MQSKVHVQRQARMRAHPHNITDTHTPAGETLVGEYHANTTETVETTGGNGLDISRRSQQFVSTAAASAATWSGTVAVVDVEQTVADFDKVVVFAQIAVLAFEERYHVVGRLVVLTAGAHFQVVAVRIVIIAVHNKLVSAACHFVGAAAVGVVITAAAAGGLSISGAPSGWR